MNILTFDLDFIFPEMNFIENDDEIKNCEVLKFLNQQSFNLYKEILKLNFKKIIVLEKHDDILSYIDYKKIKEVYNIDFHHDIYYLDEQKSAVELNLFENLEKEDKEACWFYQLYNLNNNIKYNWIGHENSEIVLSTLKYGFKFYLEEGSTLNPFNILNEIKIKNFDVLYIIKSEGYINNKQIDYCLKEIGNDFYT